MMDKLNNQQIKLVQIAVKGAGIRLSKAGDGRYRLLLGQYRDSRGNPLTSCKQLNTWQLADLLAICESMGWRHPGKEEDFYRTLAANQAENVTAASFAQIEAIRHLAGDLGWTVENLKGFIRRMTHEHAHSLAELQADEAHTIIESLKHILSRNDGQTYKDIQEVMDGREKIPI